MSDRIGVIFDMDGVIVHSNPAHKEAIQIFCDKYDLDVSDTLLENKVYGRTNKEWIPEVFGDISAEKLKELGDDKEQLFRDIFEPEEHIVSGIHNFLNRLKENDIPIAVATSAPGENADYILSSLSIKSYFDAILDSSDVTIGKPDPEVYLKAAAALDKEPTNTIVFEDSIAGVEAARQAGARVVGVTTTHTGEELAPCSLTIEDFAQLTLPKLFELFTV
jgi:HAD superfamily hydrolase (TIGR01509 family)